MSGDRSLDPRRDGERVEARQEWSGVDETGLDWRTRTLCGEGRDAW
jgi:hypothetical protein